GITPCTEYSQFVNTGGISIEDAELELNGSYVPEVGDAFTIIRNPSSGGFSSRFVGLPEGALLDFNGVFLEITYSGGANNRDIVLTAVQNVNEAIWTGAVDRDWRKPDNWQNDILPTASSSVLIPEGTTNQPVLDSLETAIADMRIEEDNTFTLGEGGKLTVSGGENGLLLFGDSITVAGELVVDDQFGGDDGINLFTGNLTVMSTGSLQLDSLGIGNFLSATIRIAGSVAINNPLANGIGLPGASTLIIEQGGNLDVTNAGGSGVFINGTVRIEGALNVDGARDNGLGQSGADELVVGPTGSVSITNCGQTGITRTGSNGNINNFGLITLIGNGPTAIFGNTLENEPGAILRTSGIILRNASFATSSSLFPEASFDCLTFFSAADFSEANITFDLEGTTACTDYDQIVLVATGDISDANLLLAGTYRPALTETFTIIDNQGGNPITGTFTGLAEGDTLAFNGVALTISYVGGDGNDVVLTAVDFIGPQTASWTGVVSSSWYDAGNWSNGRVPQAADEVRIGDIPNTPIAIIDTGAVTVTELRVVETGRFRLEEGADLTLSGGTRGLSLTGDSLIVLNGNVTISDQGANYGLLAGSDLVIGASGTLELVGTGIEQSDITSLIIHGMVTCTDAPADGILINNNDLEISATGALIIDAPGGTGIRVINDPSQIKVDGILSIFSAGENGINGDREPLTVGPTGVLTIEDAGANGINEALTSMNGLLIINGSGIDAIKNSVSFAIEDGGTLRAEGSLVGDIGFATGSNLQPGSSPGCLTFSNTTVITQPVITLDLEGPTACTEYDQITFDAFGQISGATLQLAGDYEPSLNDVFTIVRNGTDDILGTFAELPEGALIAFNNSLLEISYNNGQAVTLTAVSVLPLDLLSFIGEARDKANLLTWTTANEEDFSHFEIERSSADQWEVIGEVLSSADESGIGPASADELSYSFEDEGITAYYRLKMIDLDGTFTYSEVVYLENITGADAGALKVYPNPSTGRFTVDLTEVGLSAGGGGELRLVDLHGRELWSRRVSLD
ncbi:MAG: hypothetical protein AAF597_04615, partial [Bacteroidota bacterium]